MAKSFSPLRYPGGKTKIYKKVKNLILSNGFSERVYVEPFAGGFGIGIGLLIENIVPSVILNDFDSHIYNFWHSVLNHTEDLLRLINDTPITLEERQKQKNIYNMNNSSSLEDGFSTLFLNRVNFSGIIKAGPLGGAKQEGKYKLDCRFNKKEISEKISDIAAFAPRIKLYNEDAVDLIRNTVNSNSSYLFFNIDPPYVLKGNLLYTNFYKDEDHKKIYDSVTNILENKYPWIITYDKCDLIDNLYHNYHMQDYEIIHSAGNTVRGKEVVITNIPKDKFIW